MLFVIFLGVVFQTVNFDVQKPSLGSNRIAISAAVVEAVAQHVNWYYDTQQNDTHHNDSQNSVLNCDTWPK